MVNLFSKNIKMQLKVFGFLFTLIASYALSDDIPCAPRQIERQSVVCVCNATYCDTITSETPDGGSYVTYTTTESGRRFDKSGGSLQECSENDDDMTIVLDVETTYQTIVGFGGGATDSAGQVWLTLSSKMQETLINAYFSSSGLEYNMLRVPIGGTDFSPNGYAYNEYPENDTYLTNFTLLYEDYQYKIPMVQAAQEVATSYIKVVSSCWSPPTWMKNRDSYLGISRLLPEYLQTYALYHRKFLEQYRDNGIDVWAITTGNEPIDGVVGLPYVNTLGWNVTTFATWVCDYLRPTIDDSTVNSTLILANDDQRSIIEHWVYGMADARSDFVDKVDGIAVHWYADSTTSPDILARVHSDFPQLPVLNTEASYGAGASTEDKVVLGSWLRAEGYAKDIIEDLNYYITGWIEWNLCLNPHGGPTYQKDFLDAPILVYADDNEFIKQPMFYAIGHFAKFLPRGSVRIGQTILNGYQNVTTVSFLTPGSEENGDQQTIVTEILNMDTDSKEIVIDVGDRQCVVLNVDGKSITTVRINNNINSYYSIDVESYAGANAYVGW